MSGRSRRQKAGESGLWSGVLQMARFGLNSVIFLILARWLSLEEIGAFAVAFAVARVVQAIQRTGFVEAVVQDPEASPAYLDTLLSLSMAFSVLSAAAMYLASFFVAGYVEVAASQDYLAAMSVIPLLVGVSVVSEGLLLRGLEIRGLALRSAVSLSAAGAVALVLGMQGYGGWALTGFALVNTLFSSVWACAQARWLPQSFGARAAARRALPVILAISGRNLANSCVMPGLQIIVGVFLGAAAAGAFQIAQRFLTLAETVAISPMRYVALPLFSQFRDDRERLARIVVEATGLLAFLCAPVYFGLIAISETLLPLVVGSENAAPTLPVLQTMLLYGGIAAAIAVCNQTLTVLGRTDLAFTRAVLSLVANFGLGALMAGTSAAAVGLSYSALAFATAPMLVTPVVKAIGIPPLSYLRAALLPPMVAAAMAGLVALLGAELPPALNPILLLAAQLCAGAVIYIALSLVLLQRELRSAYSLAHAVMARRNS